SISKDRSHATRSSPGRRSRSVTTPVPAPTSQTRPSGSQGRNASASCVARTSPPLISSYCAAIREYETEPLIDRTPPRTVRRRDRPGRSPSPPAASPPPRLVAPAGRRIHVGDEGVTAVEAVLAAVDDEVARLPVALVGWVGDEVRPATAVDARDDPVDLHRGDCTGGFPDPGTRDDDPQRSASVGRTCT